MDDELMYPLIIINKISILVDKFMLLSTTQSIIRFNINHQSFKNQAQYIFNRLPYD